MKYNKRLEKIILPPEEGSKLKFKKINHMIKSPIRTVYFDIETYSKYFKNQIKK